MYASGGASAVVPAAMLPTAAAGGGGGGRRLPPGAAAAVVPGAMLPTAEGGASAGIGTTIAGGGIAGGGAIAGVGNGRAPHEMSERCEGAGSSASSSGAQLPPVSSGAPLPPGALPQPPSMCRSFGGGAETAFVRQGTGADTFFFSMCQYQNMHESQGSIC